MYRSLQQIALGSMSLRKYTDKDYPMIASWCQERGRNPPEKAALSTMGYIADNRVAGWLYLTDSNIAMIENIVSNPKTVKSLRRESLKRLCSVLIDSAFLLGYQHVFGITNHPAIEKLAKDMGMKTGSHRVWVLSETDDHLDDNEDY